MNANEWYKLFFLLAGLFFLLGLLTYLFRNSAFQMGKLPGDLFFEHKNIEIYFPIVSSIILSIILSLLFYFFRKWF